MCNIFIEPENKNCYHTDANVILKKKKFSFHYWLMLLDSCIFFSSLDSFEAFEVKQNKTKKKSEKNG